MSGPIDPNRDEAGQQELGPHRSEELRRAMLATSERLHTRGVWLSGRESSEELVAMLEGVESFELAVEARGGDLMVDEGPHGAAREPDDSHFVIPQRQPRESVATYLGRLAQATGAVRRHPPLGT